MSLKFFKLFDPFPVAFIDLGVLINDCMFSLVPTKVSIVHLLSIIGRTNSKLLRRY